MPLRARSMHLLVTLEQALLPRSEGAVAADTQAGVPCGRTPLTVRTAYLALESGLTWARWTAFS